MKLKISCPHKCCQNKPKIQVEADIQALDNCGMIDCKNIAVTSIQEGFSRIKVCLVHASGKELDSKSIKLNPLHKVRE